MSGAKPYPWLLNYRYRHDESVKLDSYEQVWEEGRTFYDMIVLFKFDAFEGYGL